MAPLARTEAEVGVMARQTFDPEQYALWRSYDGSGRDRRFSIGTITWEDA